jgi:PhzF family phenazine biosynthesis protein
VTTRRFSQVDVFTAVPYAGNPVAVVLDAEGLDDELMQRFACWTNLSETTFVLPPEDPSADYRLRIFTPASELPFAGHPTLGTCHAWLEAGGTPKGDDVVQECKAGLVHVRKVDAGLAFAGPPLVRSGPVDRETLDHVVELLGVDRAAVVDSNWVDNGPGWVGVLLESADAVLQLRPRAIDLDIGVVGPHPAGSPEAFEVRAFFPVDGATREDPVTGSLNAALAEWLLGSGRAQAPYTARQGTAIGRSGRISITRDPDGRIWTGGGAVTCVSGQVVLG